MNHYEELRNCIQSTINQTYNLKSFMESVVSNLGEANDVENIQELKKKAEIAEKEIEENILRLIKFQPKRQILTVKKITNIFEEKKLKKIKKSANNFDICFKHYLYLFNISEKQNLQPFDLKKELELFKFNACRKKSIKGIESFDYHRDEKKNAFKIKAKFNFGIELLIFSEDGPIKSYYFSLFQESLNLKQLLSMLEVKWEYDINGLDRHVIKCLHRAAAWIDSHKGIFTEKCVICNLHMNFKNGVPMLPLVMHLNHYYHVDCFFDLQKDCC